MMEGDVILLQPRTLVRLQVLYVLSHLRREGHGTFWNNDHTQSKQLLSAAHLYLS